MTSQEVLALAAGRWERGDTSCEPGDVRVVVTVSEYRCTGQSCDDCRIGVQAIVCDSAGGEHRTVEDIGLSKGPGANWDAAWAQADASGQGVVDAMIAEARSQAREADRLLALRSGGEA